MFKYLQGKKADFDMQLPQPTTTVPQTPVLAPGQAQTQGPPQQLQATPISIKPETPQIKLQIKSQPPSKEEQPYITPVDQVLLQAQMSMDSKSNDEFDEDSNTMSEVRQPKMEYDAEHAAEAERTSDSSQHLEARPQGQAPPGASDDIWWKDYFERKLEVEREKMELQRNLQQEQVQIQKMTLVQQERIERMKIDAINSLTATLQKLVEAKCRRA